MSTPRSADLAAEYRGLGWWREETFLDDLRAQARERPHKLAIAGRRVTESRTDTLDYAELAELTDRFAGALLSLGVRRGDVVAVQLPNRWEVVPLIFACMAVGAVICPISPICPEPELRHRLALTGAPVFIGLTAEIGDRLRDELSTLEHVLEVDGTRSFHSRFVAVDHDFSLEGLAVGADDPFLVLFTSGTTGAAKGVLHSPNTVHAAVRGYVDAYGLDDTWVAAVSTPLIHYSGFAQGVLAGVMLGGTVAFQDVRRNEVLLDLVERYGATLLYGPPATVADVVEAQRDEKRATPTLRHVVIGSAPVLGSLVDDVREHLGARTYSLWGMSEMGPVTMTRPSAAADRAAFSNGVAIDSMQLRIDLSAVDGESGVGRLRVRGAALALGYYGREEVFAAQFDADGWFDTGDLARHDGHGGIRIIGRASDAILRDGQVAPMTELEAVIGSHPRVLEAALVGLDSVICAVVVPRGAGPSLDEVRAHLVDAGQDFLPDRLELVSALPKTLTGKVRKAELRSRYLGER
ncbi:AMP-binding protein [Lentzea sp. NBRC 102530]|uniref:AMP-binding protein n=1 Tax=Lentzea sp. NBRC 102530 TaxID=3032201 RepID=UPI0024A204A6|nr:AMP-binding protein [Lentzea sp. NBRC 102530]GLY48969.1 cyclohexanecarboxylate-CoA ligase [Lentzea sp. NBRC 102530]